ncbi:F-box/LRR-repeat protein At3g26922-like [Zingiber officinale]|uniref:F-box domain-containing protein n=1 Tax=Zingiber officinale TaxID=94328 RepID=A0A8J5EQQ7_ZINOF|nr:F-box/LRR-repeat protein At3g26922-like [Zingiber officinale]KAG6473057.1 hypothetical protein ZIOFF_066964 [Zingiber officinale]
MDDGNNFDRCPDDVVVGSILSRLPVADLVRFGVISRRWRNQWTSVRSLDFAPDRYFNFLDNTESFDEVFTGVLNRLQSEFPINLIRCSIALPLGVNSIVLSRWLSLLGGCSVRDLALRSHSGYVFLCSFLSLIPSLEHLELARHVRLSTSPDDPFLPRLRSVALCGVKMSIGETLAFFLSKCPALERLRLDGCIFMGQTLRVVDAPRLTHLAVLNTSLRGIEIAAPALTTLEMDGVSMDKKVVLNVPSLRFLTASYVTGNRKYFFSSILETIQFDCGAFTNLLRLSIRIDMSNTIEAVLLASALRACLLLKELRLTINPAKTNCCSLPYDQFRFWEKQNYFDCLSWHLEYASIANYGEHCDELDFVQFLAREALVLKKLVIWRSRINGEINASAGEIRFQATASSFTNAASPWLDVVWN